MSAVLRGVKAAGCVIGFAYTVSLADDIDHLVRTHHWPRWRRRWSWGYTYTACERCQS